MAIFGWAWPCFLTSPSFLLSSRDHCLSTPPCAPARVSAASCAGAPHWTRVGAPTACFLDTAGIAGRVCTEHTFASIAWAHSLSSSSAVGGAVTRKMGGALVGQDIGFCYCSL